MTHDLEEVLEHYVIAMLWSTSDESDESGGVPMDQNYSIADLAPSFLEECRADCKAFLEGAAAPLLIESNYIGRASCGIAQQIGHDLWLTRVGHGCGFWDGDWKSDSHSGLDGPLTKAAKALGDLDPYVGDDGMIYGS